MLFDKECTWRPDADRMGGWQTDCGVGSMMNTDWCTRFCPFCGRPLAVIGAAKAYRRPCFDLDPALCLDQLVEYRAKVLVELIARNSLREHDEDHTTPARDVVE